jgi:hypothetical protein
MNNVPLLAGQSPFCLRAFLAFNLIMYVYIYTLIKLFQENCRGGHFCGFGLGIFGSKISHLSVKFQVWKVILSVFSGLPGQVDNSLTSSLGSQKGCEGGRRQCGLQIGWLLASN